MKIRTLLLPLLAGAAFLAGCTQGASPTTTPTTPAGNGVEALAAGDIVAKATDALNKASSYRLKGDFKDDEGTNVTLDMLVVGADKKTSMSSAGLSIEVYQISGVTYLKADDLWAQLLGSMIQDKAQQTLALNLLKGKYVKLTPEYQTMLAGVVPDAASLLKPEKGDFTKGATTTIDGKPVVTLTDGNGNKLYVATTGEPYPLRLESSNGEKMDVIEIGNKATIAAPGASDVLDMAQLLAAAGK
jgi:hypothetical protein